MASLLTSTEIASITGAVGDSFDTFKQQIIVYKKAKKTVSDLNTSFLYGYGTEYKENTNYTYTAVSGVYNGLVISNSNVSNDAFIEDSKIEIPDNEIRLKVEKDARDFIKNGMKTERIVIANKDYYVKGSDKKANMLTKDYYVFRLSDEI
tara:strand:+ start:106 stop:555 length:450 start_codon:yes stop_codon:yes gene_type:complete